MDAKIFIKELQKTVRKFEREAQDYGNIVEATDFDTANGILYLSCTVEDENGDCFACSQEFEIDENSLCPLWFHCSC